MGNFLAATAVKGACVEAVGAVLDYMEAHGAAAELLEGEPPGRLDAHFVEQPGGWTVILWPAYFNVHDFPVAAEISGKLRTLVSTMNVYDDDCWSHGLFENGVELDRFCSCPEVADLEPEEWKGDPALLARKFGVEPAMVAAYYQHISDDTDPDARAFEDDEFELCDTWVFTDFWKRLGIDYPDPPERVRLVRLDKRFADKLPFNE